jgi:hypothetical protein
MEEKRSVWVDSILAKLFLAKYEFDKDRKLIRIKDTLLPVEVKKNGNHSTKNIAR